MDTGERLSAYDEQAVARGQHPHIDDKITVAWEQPFLTAAQRRRLKKKGRSPKTHSHAHLLVVLGEDGAVRRLPCERCSPQPRQPRRVGGIT